MRTIHFHTFPLSSTTALFCSPEVFWYSSPKCLNEGPISATNLKAFGRIAVLELRVKTSECETGCQVHQVRTGYQSTTNSRWFLGISIFWVTKLWTIFCVRLDRWKVSCHAAICLEATRGLSKWSLRLRWLWTNHNDCQVLINWYLS